MQRRIGGSGVHGYLFHDGEPKKGAGLPGFVLTSKGYKVKEPTDPARGHVTPTCYIDAIGAAEKGATNNTAEAEAFHLALELAVAHNVASLHIVADSEYVLGMYERLDAYEEKQWVKGDGQYIKNLAIWKAVHSTVKLVRERGIEIEVSWVKGHSGEPGNVKADQLATIGLSYADAKKTPPDPIVSPYEGYWKQSAEYNKLLGTHYVVNVIGAKGNSRQKAISEDGYEHRYYLYADTSKTPKISTFGTTSPHSGYAIVDTKGGHDLLEEVEKIHGEYVGERTVFLDGEERTISDGMIVMIRPQDVYRRETADLINTYGTAALVEKEGNLVSVGGKKVSEGFVHTRNGMLGIAKLDELQNVFDNYEDDQDTYRTIDITDEVFVTSTKKGKKGAEDTIEYKLRPSPETDDKFINVHFEDGKKKRKVVLVYGMDLPATNALKAAAKGTPVVKLVLRKETLGMWRFYAVVESDEGRGIWHNPFAAVLMPSV